MSLEICTICGTPEEEGCACLSDPRVVHLQAKVVALEEDLQARDIHLRRVVQGGQALMTRIAALEGAVEDIRARVLETGDCLPGVKPKSVEQVLKTVDAVLVLSSLLLALLAPKVKP